ncbi:MAG: hypothetical protein A2289_22120 [Deltaproteobacteria bacterium RIFOXYA12_FULL_58_15]|nr:MAG: hypothetical protein A2289_22120 [Deltaproteobacteria bacterium RIFOXYA12_FULL_58_15]OGR12301.1 MAG: hypothetical protein A2341_20955 [Deltaproteobacteria bacterium RIFOXYB12_FULL_58_9]
MCTAERGCAKCVWRAKYDDNPRSLIGRLWRFHTKFCPGWKGYIASLPDDERDALAQKYDRRSSATKSSPSEERKTR